MVCPLKENQICSICEEEGLCSDCHNSHPDYVCVNCFNKCLEKDVHFVDLDTE